MEPIYFDDLALGERFESSGKTLSEAEILDFALRYDPQPFHMDKTAAEKSAFGGLIASGFQTLAVSFRLAIQSVGFHAANLGSPGLDEVRWLKPVRPGDTLKVRGEVVALKPSRSKPDRGLARVRYTAVNQDGEEVMTVIALYLLARRPRR